MESQYEATSADKRGAKIKYVQKSKQKFADENPLQSYKSQMYPPISKAIFLTLHCYML